VEVFQALNRQVVHARHLLLVLHLCLLPILLKTHYLPAHHHLELPPLQLQRVQLAQYPLLRVHLVQEQVQEVHQHLILLLYQEQVAQPSLELLLHQFQELLLVHLVFRVALLVPQQ